MPELLMVQDDEPIYRMRATFEDVCVFCDLPKMSVSVDFGCEPDYNPIRKPSPYSTIRKTCSVKIRHTFTTIMGLKWHSDESRVDYDFNSKAVTAINMVVESTAWPPLWGRIANKVEFYRISGPDQ